MIFHIHTQSSELKRELENRLAELENQLDPNYEYEITAEVLPRAQALERAESLAQKSRAGTVFVASEAFAAPVSAVERRATSEGRSIEGKRDDISEKGSASQFKAETLAAEDPRKPSEPAPPQPTAAPRIDRQKIKEAAAVRAARGRESLQRAATQTGAMLNGARIWGAQKAREAKVTSGEAGRRLLAKSAQWKDSVAQWNAERLERRKAETRLRQERQRAAHREAELAAIAAQIMLERQRNDEKVRRPLEVRTKPEIRPVVRTIKKIEQGERDIWPVWRNAFVAAACMALVGVFLLASGSKQTSANPATSTQPSQPPVVVPEHVQHQANAKPQAFQAVAQAPKKIAKPSARKRVARASVDDDGFQEVTVRQYPNSAPLAQPKKNSQGVVQISDME